MKTEQQVENQTAPTGEGPAALTYDEAGRVVSRTEYQPGSSKPKSISHYEYDELGRIVHGEADLFGTSPARARPMNGNDGNLRPLARKATADFGSRFSHRAKRPASYTHGNSRDSVER
jgi:hypothetical protein